MLQRRILTPDELYCRSHREFVVALWPPTASATSSKFATMLTDILLYLTRSWRTHNNTSPDDNGGDEVASASNEVVSIIILPAFDAEFPRSRGRDRAVFYAQFTIQINYTHYTSVQYNTAIIITIDPQRPCKATLIFICPFFFCYAYESHHDT